MIRVLNIAERNITPNGAAVLTIPANTATFALPDATIEPRITEIAFRSVQNLGANPLYYAFGQEASTINCHGVLQQFQQLDCSAHRLSVGVWCPVTGGTSVAICILYRNDNSANNTIVPAV